MKRILAVLLAILVSGCTAFAPKQRGMGVVADVAAVTGLVMLASVKECPTGGSSDPYEEALGLDQLEGAGCEIDNEGTRAFGTMLLSIGAIIGIAAIVTSAVQSSAEAPKAIKQADAP